ncbi:MULTISPECIES: hypothetical protein [Pseudomonas]|uniref:Uncharacterized protein n=1 Tax=Pseudomonas hunanensis TaxID=1247546 RepID=A0ACC6K9I2_9PSED|nr:MULTISPECIES: hypothetical protein [Pseudomonas]MBP2260377.1 hypothetical protein [Pseudomonas sp. BP8]MDR6715154.1 hypothetical protein [Pseudomonas hunanensis]HDS1735707.1 hypothetical protein [Pseudomonas putida]
MTLHLVATLLGRGRQLERLSDGISLVALAYGLAPLLGAELHPLASALCALLLMLGAVHKYWAIRVALDAELFARLASRDDLPAATQQLDRALFELNLKPSASDPRDWPARSQAALGLLRRQALCLGLQIVLTLTTLLTLPFIG